MSQNNYILNLLNIKDENIKILSNSLIFEKFRYVIHFGG